MASIREIERKGGTSYEVRIKLRGHPALSKSFKDPKKAKRWAQEKEVEIRGGGKVSRMAAKTTIKTVIEDYRKEHELTISAVKDYALGSVEHHLEDYTVESLTREAIKKFIELLLKTQIPPPANRKKAHTLYDGDRERTYSPGAVRKIFYALKTAVEWHAVVHGYSLGNKFMKLPVPAAWSAPRNRRLEDGEEEKLLAACDGMYKDAQGWKLLIGLALETAMRAGELLGMRWNEINSMHHFIAIPPEREKTRRGRQVPLAQEALAILQELETRRPKGVDRVFSSFPESTVQLGRGFKRIVKRAKLRDLRFHDLRHEATSRFFERTTLQTLEIALITGHAELKTLKRYANLRPEILAAKLDRGIQVGERIR